MNGKPWWTSKTIWVNTITALVAAVGAVTDVLPKEALPYVTAAVAVLNVMLRTITTKPLQGSANDTGHQG